MRGEPCHDASTYGRCCERRVPESFIQTQAQGTQRPKLSVQPVANTEVDPAVLVQEVFPVEPEVESAEQPEGALLHRVDDRETLYVVDDVMVLVNDVDGVREDGDEEVEEEHRDDEHVDDVDEVERRRLRDVDLPEVDHVQHDQKRTARQKTIAIWSHHAKSSGKVLVPVHMICQFCCSQHNYQNNNLRTSKLTKYQSKLGAI